MATARALTRNLPIFTALVCSLACTPTPDPPDLEQIHLTTVSPSVVLPGTRLRFEGSGFFPGETVFARFDGKFAGAAVRAEHRLTYVNQYEQLLRVEDHLFRGTSTREGTFAGTITLLVERDGRTLEAAREVQLAFMTALEPVLSAVTADAISFMEPLIIEGHGFLLPGEGRTRVVLDGTFHPDDGPQRLVTNMAIPASADSRVGLEAPWTPELFGLVTGSFEGSLRVVNEHSGEGGTFETRSQSLDLAVLPPVLASFLPPGARRGQAVDLLGRGFLPSLPDSGQDTVFWLDGVFQATDGSTKDWKGTRAIVLEGTLIERGRMRHVIRPQRDGRGGLEGFGHKPGVFTGRAYPTIRHHGETLDGIAWQGSFVVLPTKQVVYLKYLPTFTEALRKFGLRNVESHVRARILEVCRRDYADYNVDFREDRPTDFVDYSVIEIAGRDPNQLGLFGLDNSEGMDDGNLRLDDVIGGHNAETEEQGYFSYGGVFLESFLAFSPALGLGHLPAEFRSSRFDHIFSYFIPELDGTPVAAGEYPGGQRDARVSEAIRVLGNVIGNTVVHEIGHSLGMVSIPGRYHHDGYSPGLIMNPGQARLFEERAELDGKGPGIWHEIDREYLQKILPRDES